MALFRIYFLIDESSKRLLPVSHGQCPPCVDEIVQITSRFINLVMELRVRLMPEILGHLGDLHAFNMVARFEQAQSIREPEAES